MRNAPNGKDCFPLSKSSPHYKLVKRPSHYELIPTGRKGASLGLTLLAIIVGLICIGPNVIVVVRLAQAFYRLSAAAVTFLHLLLHTG